MLLRVTVSGFVQIREELRANGIDVYPQKEFDEDAEDRMINDKIRVSSQRMFPSVQTVQRAVCILLWLQHFRDFCMVELKPSPSDLFFLFICFHGEIYRAVIGIKTFCSSKNKQSSMSWKQITANT